VINKKRVVIAIDGVSGSGKSTLAKQLARLLHFMYLDTGAMYRAITWKALRTGIDIRNGDQVTALAQKTRLSTLSGECGMKVFIDGVDVSEDIRKPDVAAAVSIVSAYRGVREVMVRLQREIAAENDIVLEGRDVGTVVFPHADVKFYLDASVEERAARRLQELKERGTAVTIDEVRNNIEERDRIDSTRDISPLRKAADAIVIDSTSLSIAEKTDKALACVRERLKIL